MNQEKKIYERKERRVRRTRAKIIGAATRPRLAVYRSNKFVYAQLIDDEKGHTIVSSSSRTAEGKTASEKSFRVGEALGKKALEKGIKKAVFDRRSYAYHGRVKAVADGARKAGLEI